MEEEVRGVGVYPAVCVCASVVVRLNGCVRPGGGGVYIPNMLVGHCQNPLGRKIDKLADLGQSTWRGVTAVAGMG